ncbi:MAG: hypothetical protein H3C26_09650 [Rhodocyclaceae bacterium]|nr:hypothetical protein [Rhodocyclaceae bacterium]
MSDETCPVCSGIAMKKTSKIFAFKPMKCSSCGQKLRLASKASLTAILATSVLSSLLIFLFGFKWHIAFGIIGALVFLPAGYFMPLEARK